MLDLTAELVAQAASNSLVIFCFCNLLVVIILMAPKPSSNYDERSEFNLPNLTDSSDMDEQRINIEEPPKDEELSPGFMEFCYGENLGKEDWSYNSDGEDDNEDDAGSNDNDDDEFRRRIEAFIDKVNRDWKEEKLRTHRVAEQVDFCEPIFY